MPWRAPSSSRGLIIIIIIFKLKLLEASLIAVLGAVHAVLPQGSPLCKSSLRWALFYPGIKTRLEKKAEMQGAHQKVIIQKQENYFT